MRLGLNTFLVSSGFTDADIPLISQFKAYGAEVMELAIVEPASVTVSKLLTALEAAELPCPIICGAFPPGRDLRGSSEEVAATVRYLNELIDLAVQLHSKVVCGPFYSATGRAGSHTAEAREEQLEQIATALKPVCAKAAAADIVLAMEPLNRFETDCVNTLQQAVDLIDRVGSPALKIHMDTFHMNIEEEDSAAAIINYAPYIGHVHASASHRGLLGYDQVDWQGVLSALHRIGYEGDIVIESFSAGNEVIARAAAIWRPLFECPETLAVDGLKFLQDTWQHVCSKKCQPV